MSGLFNLSATRDDGTSWSMATYKGYVQLIVNFASRSSFLHKNDELEALWRSYRDQVVKFKSCT